MTNESQTLFIPLYGKAIMSKEGFFEDKTAEKIVSSLDYDFGKIDTSKKLAIYMTMRAMQYDRLAEDFIKQNPNGTIIQLGCGLDSRCNRVKAKYKIWYDVDFADVIEIRSQYYPISEKYKMIGSSVTDFGWLDKIKHSEDNVLILAEGLSMYLTENDMRNLIEQFKSHFRKSVFIFDAYSSTALKMSKFRNPVNAVNAKVSFSLDDPKIFEQEKIKCFLNNDIILSEYVNKLKGVYKNRFLFMGKFGKNYYRIYGYKISV